MTATKTNNGRFKVGDWVVFPYGAKNLFAQVIEERGPLGVKGRHLYRIRVSRGPGEPESFEMPEDEIEPASLPDKAAVIEYLKSGGLIAILRSNLSGGKNQPKVWLTYTPRGDVVHTFIAERGMVGGATVPFFVLHEGRVSTPKKNEVLAFLGTFDLTPVEAEAILAAVGTAP